MRAILATLVFVACVATSDAEIVSRVARKASRAARRSASLNVNRRASCSDPHIRVRIHRAAAIWRGLVIAGPNVLSEPGGARWASGSPT